PCHVLNNTGKENKIDYLCRGLLTLIMIFNFFSSDCVKMVHTIRWHLMTSCHVWEDRLFVRTSQGSLRPRRAPVVKVFQSEMEMGALERN
uniref:Uncharacterized protein n=1 Tax=Falco tinnunculus TaxID=100819 RepID=A0A8C4UR58_FALTI